MFLPIVLALYFLIPNRYWRNYILLAASLLFYAWGEPIWIISMIAVCLVDYVGARLLEKMKPSAGRKWFLVLLVAANLSLLVVFKYLNFFIDNINSIFHTSLGAFGYAMPIGISFFSFQALSYVIDVYRGKVESQKNPLYVIMYVSLFPQLIAGPIVRYSDVALQINDRQETTEGFTQGMLRFCIGMGKKVILANYAGTAATEILSGQGAAISMPGAWVGILLFAAQIYFDFSGYSDMAIGLGKIFGFSFKENFNYPYIARTVTDFWRRWHMSLSSFFRDYVYIPLGGNRKHQYLNIFIVWALTGFWHGASWNFIIWGMFYAVLLMIEKRFSTWKINMGKVPVLSNALLLLIVMIGWGIFYYTDLSELLIFLQSLVGLGETAFSFTLQEKSALYNVFWLTPFMVIGATPLPAKLARKVFKDRPIGRGVRLIWGAGLYLLCFVLVLGQSFNPFMYFRF